MRQDQRYKQMVEKNQAKMHEIAINIERLDREFHDLLEELNLPIDRVKSFLENSDNFSPPIWERLQLEERRLESEIENDLGQARIFADKTFVDLSSIEPHWLFVR